MAGQSPQALKREGQDSRSALAAEGTASCGASRPTTRGCEIAGAAPSRRLAGKGTLDEEGQGLVPVATVGPMAVVAVPLDRQIHRGPGCDLHLRIKGEGRAGRGMQVHLWRCPVHRSRLHHWNDCGDRRAGDGAVDRGVGARRCGRNRPHRIKLQPDELPWIIRHLDAVAFTSYS